MNKKGFTLVELMVVIVIIGVLAAVAVPRMMAAADRARAAEGPQTLGAIARMQRAHFVEAQSFIAANPANAAGITADADIPNWVALGFDGGAPISRFFRFGVTTVAPVAPTGTPPTGGNPAIFVAAARSQNFSAAGQTMWIRGTGVSTEHDQRGLVEGSEALAGLIPSWNSNAQGTTEGIVQIRNVPNPGAIPTF